MVLKWRAEGPVCGDFHLPRVILGLLHLVICGREETPSKTLCISYSDSTDSNVLTSESKESMVGM